LGLSHRRRRAFSAALGWLSINKTNLHPQRSWTYRLSAI
jgi:hypothetical protein